MLISENPESQETPQSPEVRHRVAPLWHTIAFIVILLGLSTMSTYGAHRNGFGRNHVASYLLTMAMEWLMVLFVFWGIRRKNNSLSLLLGKTRPGAKAWVEDFGVAFIFWLLAFFVLGILGGILRLFHAGSPQKIAVALAPQNLTEVILWILLSLSAGICEELVFRGYLQQQFSALTQQVSLGVIFSAVLFGIAHGYEGVSGVLLITVYGAMFSLLALKRGALRSGMMAHAFHDAIAGLALAILRSMHQLP